MKFDLDLHRISDRILIVSGSVLCGSQKNVFYKLTRKDIEPGSSKNYETSCASGVSQV